MKRLPLLLSFIALVALSASLAFWAMQLFTKPQREIVASAKEAAAKPNMEAAAGMFGGQTTAVAVSNYQLRGVVAAVAGAMSGGVAILSFDSKPAQALPVGAEVVPGVRVQEVQPGYVMLSENGVVKRIELAADTGKSTDSGVQRTPIPLPAQTPPPLPAPVLAQPLPLPVATPALTPQDMQLQQLQQQQQQLLMQQQQLQLQLQQQQSMPASRSGGVPTTLSPPPQQR